MQIINKPPPNFQEIKQIMNPPEDAFFPYGDKIYNPSGIEIPDDIIFHEQVHLKQQIPFMNPDMWWKKWLYDKEFRKKQEVEAFAEQCKLVKAIAGTKAYEACLEECAEKLSTHYKLGINFYQAKTLIRKYDK